MLTLSRSILRTIRAVARRAGLHKTRTAILSIMADAAGVRLRTASTEVALEYRHDGNFVPTSVCLPLAALDDIDGKGDDTIGLDAVAPDQVVVSWSDHGVSRQTKHEVAPQSPVVFPARPAKFTPNDAALWTALRNAATATDKSPSRYALNCVCMRGKLGRLDATDGRHIFSESGFDFPWDEELLVPAVGVLGCRELERSEPVTVGHQEDWVGFGVGPWLVMIRFQKEGRFPKIDDLLSRPDAAKSQLTLSDSDAKFLGDVLPRLPCDDVQFDPITLDLNGRVLIRSRETADGRPTEVELVSSRLSGEPVQLHSNRRYLERALRLGFRQLHLNGPDAPVLCTDQRRRFLWALLDRKSAIPRHEDPIRISSSPTPSATSPPRTSTKAKTMTVSETSATAPRLASSGAARTKPVGPKSAGSPIEQAALLRDALRVAARQANELLRSLKRQKRQTRIVESTLASLKELQKVAG